MLGENTRISQSNQFTFKEKKKKLCLPPTLQPPCDIASEQINEAETRL